jgi:hypothetical protein
MESIHMATVRLYREQGEEITGLPRVCMRCGRGATRTRSIRYWDTIWFRQRVTVPLCNKHWHFARLSRALQFAATGFAFLLLPIVMWSWRVHSVEILKITGYAIIGIALLPSVIYLINGVVFESGIRSKKITKTYIELTGVAPQFVAAVVQEWEVFRRHFANERALLPDASASGNERIFRRANDGYHTI